MRAERSSLSELGLLPDAGGQWPLATWLDSTHSRQGRDALLKLIASPPHGIEQVVARQTLLPQLAVVAKQIPFTALHAAATVVERYLASNYVVVPVAPRKRALFAARYRHIVTYVAQQLPAVDTLLSLGEQVHRRLAEMHGDEAFAAVASAFELAATDARQLSLREALTRGGRWSLAGLDAMVRDGQEDEHNRDVPTREMPFRDVPFRDVLQSLIAAIWQLDAFCSLATASAASGGVLPTIVPRGGATLAFDGLRHPLLPNGVRNDLHLLNGERVVFLTGPNMAGKSTLLRALGIAVYCAHLGMTVAARFACVPLYDQLMVSITVRDNLQRGESLYLAEIRRVRAIVEAVDSGDAVLAIFDEVFRGTNIRDATQATALLVDGLACASHGTFVIASHLAEVGESRVDREGVSCWCMGVDVAGHTPQFTYRAARGVSDVHLGMVLLDAEGVGPMLRRMGAAARVVGVPGTHRH